MFLPLSSIHERNPGVAQRENRLRFSGSGLLLFSLVNFSSGENIEVDLTFNIVRKSSA
jgi:hypothetical protein